MRARTFLSSSLLAAPPLLAVALAVALTLAPACGGGEEPPPVDPSRADAGDGPTGGTGQDGPGGGTGGTTQPAVSEECARRECNPSVSDLCCPSSCSAATDLDCGGCGNGRLEAGELCDPAGSCPQSCAQLKCDKQRLKSANTCAAVCVPDGIQTSCMDGDECCPAGCTAANDRDCTSQCGNGTLEPGELCDPVTTCPQGCPMQGCTILTLTDPGTCLARCLATGQETQCRSDDGCCPSGCTTINDNDCGVVCGNGAIEGKETCDPLASCPSACPAQGCRQRRLINPGTCTAACIDMGLETECRSSDGCCPPGCNSTNDGDCPVLCGNGVVEAGETCDPIATCLEREQACVSDGATTRTRSGDAGKCQFTCLEATRTCGPADGACPPGCGPTQDRDCPGCGNGVTEPNETCDPPALCQERQQACVSDQSTLRTPGGDPAACTFTCSETPRPCGPADGSCPAGCTADRDPDCAGCGNGLLDPGETCDPVAVCEARAEACVSDANTVRTAQGDPATCRFTCQETPRACGAVDGQCPAGCSAARDRDCPGCGNGRVEDGETCDPCLAEQVRACVSDPSTIRTPGGDPAACTFTCTSMPRPCQSGDGVCPPTCTRANDGDCREGPGGACESDAACGAGSCVDGRCCVQSCAVCQSCTGPGGTCLPIPPEQPDNVPPRSCVAPSFCDGKGGCQQPSCQLGVTPEKQDFGAVAVGAASRPFNFTVTSSCPSTVAVTSGNPREFVVVTNGCTGGVGPGKPCAIGVEFRPGVAGPRTGSLVFNLPNVGTTTVSLAGTGQIAALAWKPTAVSFGKVPVGTRSTQGITLINQGQAPTGALEITTAAPFSILQNGCKALEPNATCDLVLLFLPEKPGEYSGAVTARAASGASASAPLQGAGVERPTTPALTITPTSYGFGAVQVNGRSAPAAFQVTAGIDLVELAVASTSSEFLVANSTCSSKGLAAGASCRVEVVFAPTVAGAKQAALQASARDAGVFIVAPPPRTASASLSGTGRPVVRPVPGPGPVVTQ